MVAAAVVGGAGAIVTHNAKDFPESRLPNGIAVLHPKVFAANTVALSPERGLAAVEAIACRSGRTGRTLNVDDILDKLVQRYGLDQAVALIRRVPG